MPVTPYHFGPALAAKGLLRKRFCLITFALSQVVIDLESFYFLVQGAYPVHRFLHTYIGATVASLLSIVIAIPFLKLFKKDTSKTARFIGAFFGGYSHIILDSIMHRDIRPFAPFWEHNGLLKIISIPALHDVCIYSGIIGLIILSWETLKRLNRS